MFDSKELAERAQQRAGEIEKEQAAKTRRIRTFISATACLVLIVGLSFVIPAVLPENTISDTGNVASAALLGSGGIGGYVLMGVVGFVLGAAVMVLTLKYWKKD